MYGFDSKHMRTIGCRLMKTILNAGVLNGKRQLKTWSRLYKIYNAGHEEEELENLIDLLDEVDRKKLEDPRQSAWDVKEEIQKGLTKYFEKHPEGIKSKYIISFATPCRLKITKRQKTLSTEASVALKKVEDLSAPLQHNATAPVSNIFYSSKQEQTSAESNDYIISREAVQKEADHLSDKLAALKNEKESADLHGFSSSENAVSREINAVSKRLEILKEAILLIENGYEYWDKIGFDLTCENGGFDCISETRGEINEGTFKPNPQAEMRIPKKRLQNLKKAIESKLISKIILYSVSELNSIDEEDNKDKYWFYYLFGTSTLNENSIFLITSWTSDDL